MICIGPLVWPVISQTMTMPNTMEWLMASDSMADAAQDQKRAHQRGGDADQRAGQHDHQAGVVEKCLRSSTASPPSSPGERSASAMPSGVRRPVGGRAPAGVLGWRDQAPCLQAVEHRAEVPTP